MATLHDAVDSTKKGLLFLCIGIAILTILYFAFQGAVALKSSLFPEQIPPPDEYFGELPEIPFPANATTQKLSYAIDTITGELPLDYPERIFVYEISETEPTLQDIERAKNKVRTVGFVTKEKEISDKVFEWTDLKIFSRTMTMDIVSGNFVFSTNFLNNRTFLNSPAIVTETVAQKEGKKFFSDLASFPGDIDESLTKMQKFTVKNKKLIPSTNDAEIKVIRLDYFQAAFGDNEYEFPIYYPKPDTSPMNILVGVAEYPAIVEAHFKHHIVSETSGEYYVKTPDEAFEELQNGEGYIAAYYGTDTTIKIQDVFLGYYLGEEKIKYMQPIWIFTNKINGFYAYVPAIDDYWNDPVPSEAASE